MLTCKWQTAFCLAAALFVAGWILGSLDRQPRSHETYASYKARPDTAHVVVNVPLAPLMLRGTASGTRTLHIHDTVFIAHCLDTLVRFDSLAIASDTLSVCIARDLFSLSLNFAQRRKQLAIPYVAHDSVITRTIVDRRPWYEEVLMAIVSVAAGMLLGRL